MPKLLFRLMARIRVDRSGQDLIEYALLAGFVAVAAGAALPGLQPHFSTIFSKMNDRLIAVANQG